MRKVKKEGKKEEEVIKREGKQRKGEVTVQHVIIRTKTEGNCRWGDLTLCKKKNEKKKSGVGMGGWGVGGLAVRNCKKEKEEEEVT